MKCYPMQQHASNTFKHPPPSGWPLALQDVAHKSSLPGHVSIGRQKINSATPVTFNKMSLEMLSN